MCNSTIIFRNTGAPINSITDSQVKPIPAMRRLIAGAAKVIRQWHEKPSAALALILAGIIILIVRLIRPLVLVRFCQIASYRIGHFAEDVEVYLSEKELALQPSRTLDLFYYGLPISNSHMKTMSDRALITTDFARWLDLLNRRLPGAEKHQITKSSRDPAGLGSIYVPLTKSPVHLEFTAEEHLLGRQALQDLGVPNGAPFVCFMSRDSAYLNTALPGQDWRYHDYRNSTIHNYILAGEKLSQRGCFTIRLGSVVMDPLNSHNPMVIDYATTNRTDFLDIYLSAKCKFFIGSGTGLDAVATVFRRPIACVNYSVLGFPNTWGPNDLVITKKLWLQSENRFLTMTEVLSSGVGMFGTSEQFKQSGIDLIENSPEEIADLAMEMEDRLSGTWNTNHEYEELQDRYWSFFDLDRMDPALLPRIGSHFLKHNQSLLD